MRIIRNLTLGIDQSLPPGEKEISRLCRGNFREGLPNKSQIQQKDCLHQQLPRKRRNGRRRKESVVTFIRRTCSLLALISFLSGTAFANITLPPEPPAPQIPAHQEDLQQSETSPSADSTAVNNPADALANAWVFEFNDPVKERVANILVTEFHQKGVPAFITPLPSNTMTTTDEMVKISIGPEIDPQRLNLLETRVNIDSKLGTVRRFQPELSTELSA